MSGKLAADETSPDRKLWPDIFWFVAWGNILRSILFIFFVVIFRPEENRKNGFSGSLIPWLSCMFFSSFIAFTGQKIGFLYGKIMIVSPWGKFDFGLLSQNCHAFSACKNVTCSLSSVENLSNL
jgi:hypothetical protein